MIASKLDKGLFDSNWLICLLLAALKEINSFFLREILPHSAQLGTQLEFDPRKTLACRLSHEVALFCECTNQVTQDNKVEYYK